MSASRTQIYFPAAQRDRIDRAATAAGVTMAELVRRAVDVYLDTTDVAATLRATYGADPEAVAPAREQRAWLIS